MGKSHPYGTPGEKGGISQKIKRWGTIAIKTLLGVFSVAERVRFSDRRGGDIRKGVGSFLAREGASPFGSFEIQGLLLDESH